LCLGIERGPSHDKSGAADGKAMEVVESSDSEGSPSVSESESGSESDDEDEEETQVARPMVVKRRASVSLAWMESERRAVA
jgi:hypothetical protein